MSLRGAGRYLIAFQCSAIFSGSDAVGMQAAVHLVPRDADAAGIVIATRDNWTGKAWSLPRGDLENLRPNLGGAGVYVMVGAADNDDTGVPVIYIGEAEDVTSRLSMAHTQLGRLDVTYQRLVVFTSQSDDLNKAHVKWLEAELVRRARLASRCTLANGNSPTRPSLTEFDQIFVESFLVNMLVLYPLLGVDVFTPPPSPSPLPTPARDDAPVTRGDEQVFMSGPDGTRATALLGADNRLTLLAGSRISRVPSPSENSRPAALRKLLEGNGQLDVVDEEWWSLRENYGPLTASGAAGLVVGYSINGRTAWKNAAGTPIAQLER